MSTEQKIKSIIKQNDSIYASLIAKGIEFVREIIPEKNSENNIDDEQILALLLKENERLKEIAKQNKPPPQIKEPKAPQEIKPVEKSEKPKESKKEQNDCESGDEYEYEPPKPKFDCITNMEDIKRAFFNKDYVLAKNLILNHGFKYYEVNYKYNSDKDGAPDFVAKNLLKGFVRNFDDYRKYFMICFRCIANGPNYEYKSKWIVNTNEPVGNVIGSLVDDFDFVEVTENISEFIDSMEKLDESTQNLIGEAYVH